MITYEHLNQKISQTILSQRSLAPLKEEFSEEISNIHSFIDMFLDRFGDRVVGDKTNSPEWKLYSEKTAEYNSYSRAIRNVDYFMAKERLNVK
jgi:hypothetical protein